MVFFFIFFFLRTQPRPSRMTQCVYIERERWDYIGNDVLLLFLSFTIHLYYLFERIFGYFYFLFFYLFVRFTLFLSSVIKRHRRIKKNNNKKHTPNCNISLVYTQIYKKKKSMVFLARRMSHFIQLRRRAYFPRELISESVF